MRRNEEAREAAERFFSELSEGKYEWSSPDFHEGAFEQASSAAAGSLAPHACQQPERLAADFKISRRLIAKLDQEKNIQVGCCRCNSKLMRLLQ